jgi:hypothetical protein
MIHSNILKTNEDRKFVFLLIVLIFGGGYLMVTSGISLGVPFKVNFDFLNGTLYF